MSLIEIIAVIFSFLSVILAIKVSILNWSIGIVGIIFYFIIFWKDLLYSNAVLQIIYLAQSIYGIYEWSNNRKKIKKDVQISFVNWNLKSIFQISIFILISNFIFCFLFRKNQFYICDSITTSLSIFAYYLLTKGKMENWIFWILVDIIYIYLFIVEKLYLSAALYSVFIILCIKGLVKWSKIYDLENKNK